MRAWRRRSRISAPAAHRHHSVSQTALRAPLRPLAPSPLSSPMATLISDLHALLSLRPAAAIPLSLKALIAVSGAALCMPSNAWPNYFARSPGGAGDPSAHDWLPAEVVSLAFPVIIVDILIIVDAAAEMAHQDKMPLRSSFCCALCVLVIAFVLLAPTQPCVYHHLHSAGRLQKFEAGGAEGSTQFNLVRVSWTRHENFERVGSLVLALDRAPPPGILFEGAPIQSITGPIRIHSLLGLDGTPAEKQAIIDGLVALQGVTISSVDPAGHTVSLDSMEAPPHWPTSVNTSAPVWSAGVAGALLAM